MGEAEVPPMPQYRFFEAGVGGRWRTRGCCEFMDLDGAREEAKRLAAELPTSDLDARIVIEGVGCGIVFVVPAHEGIWLVA